jgi:SAM-dependent MidA family methyltransferase
VRVPTSTRTQADFLAAFGLDDLLDAAKAAWQSAAAPPTLDALAARSRISEAAALTDPAGLGAFRVLEWELP